MFLGIKIHPSQPQSDEPNTVHVVTQPVQDQAENSTCDLNYSVAHGEIKMSCKQLWRGLSLAFVQGIFVMAFHGASDAASEPQGGLVFNCPADNSPTLADALKSYFQSLGVGEDIYSQTVDEASGALQFTLRDRAGGTDTLSLIHRLDYDLKETLIELPSSEKIARTVVTVSQKEILLALLQHGRTTRFNGQSCSAQALIDVIGVRQNTVAWSESLKFVWPDGEYARWNSQYWRHGDLKAHVALHAAVADVFMHPQKYSIGCYTATKLVIIQGVLDYYRRIKNDVVTAQAIEARLMQDGEPLSNIEPGAAWYFEQNPSPENQTSAGKLVFLEQDVAADNFVPGDWTYFLNTDPVSYQKTGYEGSNAIYLGRGKFDDYYNDNNHSYTYQEKLLEVYQWRHNVFSKERDVAKIHPLTAAEIRALGQTPENGGLQLDLRMTPYAFGFAELPPVQMSLTRQ